MFTIILRKEVAGQPMYVHFNVNGGFALCYHTDQNNAYVPGTRTTVNRRGLFSHINWLCDYMGYRVQLDTRFETEEEYYEALAATQETYQDTCLDYVRSSHDDPQTALDGFFAQSTQG